MNHKTACGATLIILTMYLITVICNIEYDRKLEKEAQKEEVIVLDKNVTVETPAPTEGRTYFDVDLSTDIQDHIFTTCEAYNVAPELIIAIIENESKFNADLVGDSGNSIGLMQIQPKWHKDRMKKLGVTDLKDAKQNITVGIDLISELKESNQDIYWVLMAYNGGTVYANKMMNRNKVSNYASSVVERMNELGGING